MKTISERIWNASQSWNYEHIATVDGHKVRVRIRRNFYDTQSYAEVQVFSVTEGWKQITSLSIGETATSCFSSQSGQTPALVNAMRSDAANLIDIATAVLT